MRLPKIDKRYGPFVLRVALGLLFIIPGAGKLFNPAAPTSMLAGLGFPAPAFFAWLLIAAEVLGGLALLAGWQVRWAVLPLAVVMLVAIFTVVIPNMNGNPVNLLFHILALAGLTSVYATGPGAWALGK